jgi:glucokinase
MEDGFGSTLCTPQKGVTMAHLIGIDVGGTSIKAGLFSGDGKLLGVKSVPTGALDNAEEFAKVNAGLHELIEAHNVDVSDIVGVGLDVPGPVDSLGNVGMLANIKLDATAFSDAIKASFPGARLAFINDANAAALGEAWVGAGRGQTDFVMITLGTGVGGGIISGGRLIAGHVGAGGEIGHITVNPGETEHCGCGRRGCLEQYSSASGIVRLYKQECAKRGEEPAELKGPSDSYTVFQRLAAGSAAAEIAINRMCEYLAIAMSQLSAVVDPAIFVIGGGVVGSFDVFKEQLGEKYRATTLLPTRCSMIVPAELGNEAGMYGSAYCAMQLL